MNEIGHKPILPAPVERLSPPSAYAMADVDGAELTALMGEAARLRDLGHGDLITYSRNVFIPLTHLCRDVCHYCTFAETPNDDRPAFMSPDAVLRVARDAAAAGCTEALFTLGDKPELRYARARRALADMGHATTLSYLAEMAALVQRETGLLAHVNPGVLTRDDMQMLRRVSVSQGLMLESLSERLCQRGGPHFGSPDKHPAARLETVRLAGELSVPFTSGLLIGIGETRAERIDALLALRDLHDAHGHIQELIIQNFKPKPGTRMADAAPADFDELLWTIAAARLLFGPVMNIQAPPNLTDGDLAPLIAAGINDWGGVSPLTPDYVNPEAPWPAVTALAEQTAAAGKVLVERLAVYPPYARDAQTWLDADTRGAVMRHGDADGLARTGTWFAGATTPAPDGINDFPLPAIATERTTDAILDRATGGADLSESEVSHLLSARGPAAERVCDTADQLRRQVVGDEVTYVVNCNINYTNICTYHCAFCAFSKGRAKDEFRDRPYLRGADDVVALAAEAVARGATEVCLQGGIHPSYTGDTYLGHAAAVHAAFPDLHIHGFSPLEIWHGAETLGLPVAEFLIRMKAAGLRSLPGTAAEILDDEVRAIICPDKLTTDIWLDIMAAAHGVGLPTTATIMFGHVEGPHHVARHLLRLRQLQQRTGGFTEFVPLPFVHMESPIALKNQARRGPTYREAVLMHAVARLALHPHIPNIQTSWVKMGLGGAEACLRAGANDLGGVLMKESISRAAGAAHGQEFEAGDMRALITGMGRQPRQRSTDYGCPSNSAASPCAAAAM